MKESAIEFFTSRFNINLSEIGQLLSTALSKGGDYADLYFEYRISNSVMLDEQLVKSASKSISQGVGVRVNAGEKTGYAYTDEISLESIKRAALTAAYIAQSAKEQTTPINVTALANKHNLYAVAEPLSEISASHKIELVKEVDQLARNFDKRIREVQAMFADEYKIVMIATSEGVLAGDVQPLSRFGISCIADEDGNLQMGRAGGGGRSGMELFQTELTPKRLAEEAARQAIINLEAVDAPAGAMEVVLGPGWPGILLHEAVGHGLEADFNRKKTSAFADLLGQRVASELCTIVDDGTIPNRRGSLNIDDEGNPTTSTVLIEKGILKGFINDKLNARLLGVPYTGNGRRESYQHIPMPRMTNTFMLAGTESTEDIIRSVKRGIYAVQFGGGQVDITNGKFVFSTSEAYLIEDGKITAPVKGATLIGNGPDALTKVTAVGNDMALDHGIGTCGKDGQSVPVGVGLPTIKISEMTVGGTKS
ncbi:MAG: metalloprotease TldD [Blastocatellia bacterium]|nr:metalloprotease TldD [Blastocatellia bacterium]MBL8192474.1 metalloprotease TldD [Blastocatellia bacterium]